MGEWQQVVEKDAEMKLVNAVELKTVTGEVIKLENEGLSLWTNPENGDLTYFTYRDGRISVKSPSDGKLQYQVLCKMKQLAEQLQANVQGNDGEFY